MEQQKQIIIDALFNAFGEIRYAGIYQNSELFLRQRRRLADASSDESDKYEELLVNPTLLTLAKQRGNIDCGGLRFLIIGYGNFYQLVRSISDGHISICLDKQVDLVKMPESIFSFLDTSYPGMLGKRPGISSIHTDTMPVRNRHCYAGLPDNCFIQSVSIFSDYSQTISGTHIHCR